MSNYIQTRMLGIAAPMVDSKKGDTSNRVKCAGAQLANNVRYTAETALIVGGTAVGIKAAAKNQKFVNKMDKVLTKAFNSKIGKAMTEPFKDAATIIKNSKAFAKFKNLPAKNKGAIALIAGLGLAALSFVGCKQIYKSGQIDQKYTDKAALEKHNQSEVL